MIIREAIMRGGSRTKKALPPIILSHNVFRKSEVIAMVMHTAKVTVSHVHLLLNNLTINPGNKPDKVALRVKPGK